LQLEKEKEEKAKNTTGAKVKQTTENFKSKTMSIFKKKDVSKEEEQPASAQEGKPPAEQLEMPKPVTKKVAQKANLEVPQEKKAVYEEPKREYRPKVNDRDFWEAQQTYEHLKKQISQMNTSMSGFLKSYSNLQQFNTSFGKKVEEAFPTEHHFSKEAKQIGSAHRNAQAIYTEQQVQLQNLY